MAALLPGPRDPAVAAKQLASIDVYGVGRVAVNVMSGWFKGEFTALGEWWLSLPFTALTHPLQLLLLLLLR